MGWTRLSASLAIQGQGQRFPLSLEVHDWFSYTKPVIAAGAELQAFLQDPSQSTIEVQFGLQPKPRSGKQEMEASVASLEALGFRGTD